MDAKAAAALIAKTLSFIESQGVEVYLPQAIEVGGRNGSRVTSGWNEGDSFRVDGEGVTVNTAPGDTETLWKSLMAADPEGSKKVAYVHDLNNNVSVVTKAFATCLPTDGDAKFVAIV